MKYLTLLGLILTFNCFAQAKKDTIKLRYSIFKPVPKELMREFETDRPDITESAYSVDAGHFQVETDLFKTQQVKINGTKTTQNYFNLANIKLGITNSLDLQLVVTSLVHQKTVSINTSTKKSEFGGFTFRVKQNIWGNDEGKTALAVMPFINIPALKSGTKFTGGIIFPFALSLPNDWGFGAQFQTNLEENQNQEGYHLNFLTSTTLSHSIFKNCNFFIEGYITQETEINDLEYFANGGLIYEIGNNVKLDAGFNYGFKQESAKVYFIGLSFRY